MNEKKSSFQPIDIAYIAMAVALMSVCSWIEIPTTVPFTLQTFAVFLSLILLGGARGTMSVLVYILLGAAGAPVFSGGSGGLTALFSSSGGYIIGFFFSALTIWGVGHLLDHLVTERIRSGMKRTLKKKILLNLIQGAVLLLGLLICYTFGTAWFVHVYVGEDGSHVGFLTALSWCVFPFILADLAKIALALFIGSNKALRNVIAAGTARA